MSTNKPAKLRKTSPINEHLQGYSKYHMQMESDLFTQSIELSKLSIDLARLDWERSQSMRDPIEFLETAVKLVNEAALFAALHPDIQIKRDLERVEREIRAQNIPLEQIFGQQAIGVNLRYENGAKYLFPPFTSERGLVEFVTKHFHRMVNKGMAEIQSEIIRLLSLPDQALESAKDLILRGHYACRAGLLVEIAKALPGSGSKWASTVFEAWKTKVVEVATAECLQTWKHDGIRLVDMDALAETRRLANLKKGKRKTPGNTENEGSHPKGEPQVKKRQVSRKKEVG